MKKLLTTMLCMLSIPAFAYKTIELNSKNTINFNQAFSSSYVAKKQIEAITLCAQNIGSEINIVLYTPGGSISAGQRLYDTLNALPCQFNTVTVFAASMGYQTVQQLGKRYIMPSSTLMSHRASVRGLSGEVGGELDQILNLIKTNVEEMEIIAAKRAGITLEKYKEEIRDELWLTGTNAVKTGHADQLVFVRCDESLLGTSLQRVQTFFGAFDVEFSNCPIITGPLEVKPASNNANVNKLYDMYNNIGNYIKVEM